VTVVTAILEGIVFLAAMATVLGWLLVLAP
jgi:hypothetical protein